jgi:hypothetical protein
MDMRVKFFQNLHKLENMCCVCAFLTVVCISLPFSSLADEIDLTGTWGGWGTVVLKKIGGNYYKGTYTDTYYRERGNITLTLRGLRGSGSWNEDVDRGGKLFNIKVSQDGQTITGKWNTTKFEYGSFVEESSLTWLKRRKIAKINDLYFVKKNESDFDEIKEISYGEPFYIKAVFDSPPEEDEKTVTLDWGEGTGKKIIVERQKDKKIFLSDIIYVKRPTSSKEGE